MILKRITNTSDKDILDYPIAEAKLDQDGNVMYKQDGSNDWEWTGRTLQWSVPTGATLEFPEYVANYLMGIYPFIVPAGEDIEVAEPAKPREGYLRCKHCGQDSKNSKGLALHIAARHPEKLL